MKTGRYGTGILLALFLLVALVLMLLAGNGCSSKVPRIEDELRLLEMGLDDALDFSNNLANEIALTGCWEEKTGNLMLEVLFRIERALDDIDNMRAFLK